MLSLGQNSSEIAELFLERHADYESFKHEIVTQISLNNNYTQSEPKLGHVKVRYKSQNSLVKKIENSSRQIDKNNALDQISDYAGIRFIVHSREQIKMIDDIISDKIINKRWLLKEPPTVYEIDENYRKYFSEKEYVVQIKESYYTSVHYVIAAPYDSKICCEVQLRTFFEEAWSEIDHYIKYKSDQISAERTAIHDQLRTLAYIMLSARTLVDSMLERSK